MVQASGYIRYREPVEDLTHFKCACDSGDQGHLCQWLKLGVPTANVAETPVTGDIWGNDKTGCAY